jgi:hypothetical protein
MIHVNIGYDSSGGYSSLIRRILTHSSGCYDRMSYSNDERYYAHITCVRLIPLIGSCSFYLLRGHCHFNSSHSFAPISYSSSNLLVRLSCVATLLSYIDIYCVCLLSVPVNSIHFNSFIIIVPQYLVKADFSCSPHLSFCALQ